MNRDAIGAPTYNSSENFSSCDQQWGYGYRTDVRGRAPIFPPLWHTGSTILDGGEPFVFHRFFEGHKETSYIELNQKICQLLNIFWVDIRKAYCRFDENGDFQDVVQVLNKEQNHCVTISSSDLNLILYLTNSNLIRVFDFTRANDWNNFAKSGQSNEKKVKMDEFKLYGKLGIKYSSNGEYLTSWLRGFHIIQNSEQEEKMISKIIGEGTPEKQYATFIVNDFRHETINKVSCNPMKSDNYFQDTGKPFATSPAFFKPEVMLKYKAHPDKYNVSGSSIQCRGAWFIKRYDVNEEGQINVLLCDLAQLPYSEQVYWQSFNEEPKGTISERSFTQDFEGEFFEGYDPLNSLESILNNFPKAAINGVITPIWEYRGQITIRKTSRLNYVLTDSAKEWSDQMIELATILNDGLNISALKTICTHIKYNSNEIKELGSIKLLEKCLVEEVVGSTIIREIIDPLYELQRRRSRITAHADEDVPTGNLGIMYKHTLEDCDRAMRSLAKCIENGCLNIP